MSEDIKEILKLAAEVVLSRHGDINTEDGCFATVEIDAILRLDYAMAECFKLDTDDINYRNMDDLISKIESLD